MRVSKVRRVLLVLCAALVVAIGAFVLSKGCSRGGDAAVSTAGDATTHATSTATTQAAWGVPDRPIRVIAYNVYWHQRGVDRVAASIRQLEPDVVLLSEIPPNDLPALAAKLKLAAN